MLPFSSIGRSSNTEIYLQSVSRWLFVFVLIAFATKFVNAGPVHANDSDSLTIRAITLDDLVVTTHRYSRNIRNIAAPFQLIRKEQILRNDAGVPADLLNTVAGVDLQFATHQTTKLTIRGIGSRSPYGTTRTKAFLNEIPLTAGDGTTIFDDLELSFIDRVEITKGPHSAWYGSGMGGAVRFVTLQAPESAGNEGLIQATAGSYGINKWLGNVRIREGSGAMNIGLAKLEGDGYRQNSAFKRNSMMLSGEYDTRPMNSKLNYLLVFSDVHAFTPSSIDLNTYLLSPADAAPNWLAVNGFKSYQRILGGLKVESPISKLLSNQLTISGSVYDQYELRPFNILDDQAIAMTIQESVMWQHESSSASLGVEWQHEQYRWKILENNTLIELNHAMEARNQLNGFFSAETRWRDRWLFSLAGNLNGTWYAVHQLYPEPDSAPVKRYFNQLMFSPKAGVSYQPNIRLNLYGSAAHGFSNPSVEESLSSEGVLNVDLRPEQGWTFDLGVKTILLNASWWLDASVYYIMLQDLLVTKRLSEAVFFGDNAGSSILKGIELSSRYHLNKWLNASFSLNVSNNQFLIFSENDVEYSGNHLPGIPSHKLYAEIAVKPNSRIIASVHYQNTGRQYLNDLNTKQLDGWQTVGVRAEYTLPLLKLLSLQLMGSVNNVFNEHYASMILINAPAFAGRAPRYYYPGMPRNYVFSARLIW